MNPALTLEHGALSSAAAGRDKSSRSGENMSNSPRVSVIMAVYNAERYVGQAIASILAQTTSDFEVIAVDDGSTDASAQVLAHYPDPRIHVLHQCNTGPAGARNAGIAIARGQYIAIHDADDLAAPERLEKQIRFLEKNPAIALVGSHAAIIDEDGKTIGAMTGPPEHDLEIRWRMLFENPFIHSSVMFRRSLTEKLGWYTSDAAIVKALVEDYDLCSRIACVMPVANLPEVLVQYRVHPDNSSARTREEQRVQVRVIAARNMHWVTGWDSEKIEQTWRSYDRFWRHPPSQPLDMDRAEARRIGEFLVKVEEYLLTKHRIDPEQAKLYRRRYSWPRARHALALSLRQNGRRNLACRLTLFASGINLLWKMLPPVLRAPRRWAASQ
jgi:glycosyltransferase involved in cell wall biosynthesis